MVQEMTRRSTRTVPWTAVVGLIGLLVCPERAAHSQARWIIEPDLRIGTLDEGPASFADIRGVAVGEGGSVWVLDFKTQEIRAFDAKGKFIRLIARSGSGPGEIRRARRYDWAGPRISRGLAPRV